MGYGDHLMAIGAASRQHALDPERRKVAIGDGRRVDTRHPELRYGLDFLATQADVDAGRPLSWLLSWQGVRPYHDHAAMAAAWRRLHPWRRLWKKTPQPHRLAGELGHYVFNAAHRAVPAPLVLDDREAALAAAAACEDYVVIEPHIKDIASPGKRWPFERYAAIAQALQRELRVVQVGAPGTRGIVGIERLETASFRDLLPYLKAARLYIGPEGGLHHAAAAMGTPAVVLFGGYTPPAVTGYDFHVNLTGGAEACGVHLSACAHCVEAMERIGVDEVLMHACRLLD